MFPAVLVAGVVSGQGGGSQMCRFPSQRCSGEGLIYLPHAVALKNKAKAAQGAVMGLCCGTPGGAARVLPGADQPFCVPHFHLRLQRSQLSFSCVLQPLKCSAPQNPRATPSPWTGGRWGSLPTSCSGPGYGVHPHPSLSLNTLLGGLMLYNGDGMAELNSRL